MSGSSEWQAIEGIPPKMTVMVESATGIECLARMALRGKVHDRHGQRWVLCWRADSKTGGDIHAIKWRFATKEELQQSRHKEDRQDAS